MKSPYFAVVSATSADEAFQIFSRAVISRVQEGPSQWFYGFLEMVRPDDCALGFVLTEADSSAEGKQLQSCMLRFLEVQEQMATGKCLIMRVPESSHEWAVCGFAGTY